MAKKKKKLKIPASVRQLVYSEEKFAKKNGIKVKGKGLNKKERKRNLKRLHREYAEAACRGLNRAVRILADYPEHKKVDKVKEGVENIITNTAVMKKVAKIYKKDSEHYPNMVYLPDIIMNTLLYYSSDALSEEEKAIGASLDKDALVDFCEAIIKKPKKRLEKVGLAPDVAFQIATVIPTTKVLRTNSHVWYKRLIQSMYDIANKTEVDPDLIIQAVYKMDKKKYISKKDYLIGFFSEFIRRKSTNAATKVTDTQRELHETLVNRTLVFLNSLKPGRLKNVLKQYIKHRKTAEEYKNDTKRVIKFTDHAHSNSPYTNIKTVVSELIEDNSANELYLG